MLIFADALEGATWALVVATALLVVAAGIPAIASLAEYREKKRRASAELVPDIHMLRSRFNGVIASLSEEGPADAEHVEYWMEDNDEQLGILARLLDLGPEQGLRFTNELYVCRHLLSQARYEMRGAAREARERAANGDATVPRDALARALRLYAAARTTLQEAESLVPAKARSIDGESFWDRFTRVSHERERGADQELMRRRGS
jgi:hypothetical protein